MTSPPVGSVWERDGKRRKVLRIAPCPAPYAVVWWRPWNLRSVAISTCSARAWDRWARHARRVDPAHEDPGDVA